MTKIIYNDLYIGLYKNKRGGDGLLWYCPRCDQLVIKILPTNCAMWDDGFKPWCECGEWRLKSKFSLELEMEDEDVSS